MSQPPSALSRDDVSQWSWSADIVVIGQGIGGVCAALEAHRAGAETLIVERASGGGVSLRAAAMFARFFAGAGVVGPGGGAAAA